MEKPRGAYGKCALAFNGKDTTTGHWEMAGIILECAFPTYPHGFPQPVIDQFMSRQMCRAFWEIFRPAGLK